MLAIEQFERAARRYPERLITVSEDGDLTHREMAELVVTVASAIARQGLGSGTHIALLTPNHPMGMACQYAIFKAGCVWVPCNHRNTAIETARQVVALDVDWLFYHSSLEEHVNVIRQALPSLKGAVAIDRGTATAPAMLDWAAGYAPGAPLPERQADDPIVVMSTGGTTGVPKGAVHTNRSYEANMASYWATFDFTTPPVHLITAPLTHAAGVIHWAMVGAGATHVLSRSADPDVVLGLVQRHRVSIMFLPPTIIYMLLSHPRLKDYDCSSLRYFLFGAAPISTEKLKEAIKHFGPIFCNLYGSTEALVMNTVMLPSELADAVATPSHAGRVASCGREAPFCRLEIIDDHGAILPPNQRGEVAVRGGFVMTEYYKEPEKTAASRTNGWHRMGDVGFKDDDGYVYLVDRKNDMIITGGFNVFPAEVEQVILAYPSVQDCVVVGIPHEKWGEAILAAVELKPGCQLDRDELIANCKAQLGSVKAPKFVEVVSELPRSPVGKTLRRAVRAQYWAEPSQCPVGGDPSSGRLDPAHVMLTWPTTESGLRLWLGSQEWRDLCPNGAVPSNLVTSSFRPNAVR